MASPHILLFPFMAKGHAIPLLQLARLLLRHGAAVTVVTTPGNRSFICGSLPASISVVDIPFPQNISGIPAGVESTDKLPDISLWVPFAAATKLMQPHFDRLLESLLPTVSFIITDDFFSWTLDSAVKYNVPRLVFYALGPFSLCLTIAVARRRFVDEREGGVDMVRATDFPRIKIKREDVDPVFIDPKFSGTDYYNYVYENIESSSRSHGIVMNSFSEFDSVYVDAWNSTFGPKMWSVGPFCLAEEEKKRPEIDPNAAGVAIQWLDRMSERGERVLYVAFGTQIEISPEQFEEIKTGLEKSGVSFLWVVRRNESQLEDGFEERVRERGIVVREWVDQREILEHAAVEGFMTQCGWTSVVESVCAKVPILAFPAMWCHPLNAIFVAEEMRVGLRAESCGGFVKWESLAAAAKELMEGEMGKEVRKNAAEIGGAAVNAVEGGGSSWRILKQLLSEFGQTPNP